MTKKSAFGVELERRMFERGWSGAECARRTGLTEASISRYVNGVQQPRRGPVEALASALAWPAHEALALAGYSSDQAPASEEALALARSLEAVTATVPADQRSLMRSCLVDMARLWAKSISRGDIAKEGDNTLLSISFPPGFQPIF